jgi:hypothetical protein
MSIVIYRRIKSLHQSSGLIQANIDIPGFAVNCIHGANEPERHRKIATGLIEQLPNQLQRNEFRAIALCGILN